MKKFIVTEIVVYEQEIQANSRKQIEEQLLNDDISMSSTNLVESKWEITEIPKVKARAI